MLKKRLPFLFFLVLASIVAVSLRLSEQGGDRFPLPTERPTLALTTTPFVTKTPTEPEVLGQKVPTDGPLYPVVKVIDGDTIVVKIDGWDETVRLIGIDTPETVDPRKPVECFGKRASAKAKELLSGQKVRLETDAAQGERGRYGRLLRYVFLEDETFFNLLMIQEGYAHEYTYQTPYQYQTKFKQAEMEARENGRGLWAKDACGDDVKGVISKASGSATPVPNIGDGTCDCSANVYNCGDFSFHAKAQSCYDSCGGVQNDIHNLDSDGDGKACEGLR